MLCRVTERRGLHDTDGNTLPYDVIRAAWHGSATDGDICHLSVRDMVCNMCNYHLVQMIREFYLEGGLWYMDQYDECGRYADDILHDWRAGGSGTYISLHDTAAAYIREILASPAPDRRFGAADFVYSHKYGTIPNTIPSPKRAAPYRIGEGHTTAPDGVGHPLLAHMVHCTPPGLLPHNRSGCGYDAVQNPWRVCSPAPRPPLAQPEKEEAIRSMAERLGPDAAYMLERNGRHDILLYGDIDAAQALDHADAIQYQYGTPTGCIMLQSDDILGDRFGNDAKCIVARGVPLAGSLHTRGPIEPPRPAAITESQMVWNLDRFGFPLCVRDAPYPERPIRAEYVVAASQYFMEARWYLTGAAMLLRRLDIDWGLMVYLAKTYRFAGLVRDILEALEGVDGDGSYQKPLRMLRGYAPVLDGMDMQEVVRFVGGERPAPPRDVLTQWV